MPVERVLTVALFPFLVMLFLEAVCFRLLLSRHKGAQKTADIVFLKEQTTKELDGAQERFLPEPAPSVTDHTTRTLEPVYNERKSK